MSLYSTGFYIRRGILGFVTFIGLIFSIGLIGTITGKLSNPLTTTVNEKPSQLFGNITPAKIKESTQASIFKPQSYSIDTVNGSLPDFKNKFGGGSDNGLVNIFQIDTPEINNEARDRGRLTASSLGFTDSALRITDKDIHYEWSDGKRNLLYNVDTRTFEMFTTNVASLDTPIEFPGTIENATNYVTNFLKDVKTGTTEKLAYFKADYVNYDSSKTSWNISNATNDKPGNFIRVSYMRYSRSKGKDPLPDINPTEASDPTIVKEYYPNYDYSPMYIVIKNNRELKPSDLVEINFYKYDYDITRPQTYDVKNVNNAYNELKSGSATLVKVSTDNNQIINDTDLSKIKADIKVKDVDVGYYMSNSKTGYALPVYVFKTEFVIATEGLNQKKGQAIYYVYAFQNSN